MGIAGSPDEHSIGPRERWYYRLRGRLIASFFIGSLIADLVAWGLGLDLKLFWAFLSAAITLTGYAIYISQMFPQRGGTAVKPEPLSWVIFGFLTATGALVQLAQGGDAGSWCLLITAAACFVIAGWSYLKWRSEWRFDSFQVNHVRREQVLPTVHPEVAVAEPRPRQVEDVGAGQGEPRQAGEEQRGDHVLSAFPKVSMT